MRQTLKECPWFKMVLRHTGLCAILMAIQMFAARCHTNEVIYMTVKRKNPYIWATWLSKLLVGDASCEWAIWFKAHHQQYEKTRMDFNSANWRMKHTRLITNLREQLSVANYAVYMEKQNSFRLQVNPDAMLAGQPDIIAAAPDGRLTIYDAKTGVPRDSDVMQVMIYMYALPRVAGSKWGGRTFDGCLVYGDGTRRDIPASAINADFVDALNGLLRRIVSDAPAFKVPSDSECAWCDLTIRDCVDRVD